MRMIILLGIGLVIAYWADQHYYYGKYSQETGDTIKRIAATITH